MIDAFTDHFSNSMDMRNGSAATCTTNEDCSGTTTKMCCGDIYLQNNNFEQENIFRCMNKETVEYGYGVSVRGTFV